MEDKGLIENSSNNKSNKVVGIVFAFVGVIVIIGALFSLFGDFKKGKLEVSNASLSVEYNEYLGYSAKVTGIVRNNTGKDYSYVQIEYAIYDANGNNLGTALDNINNLAAGDTWNFEANLFSFPSARPVTFKFIEIDGW